MFPFIKTMHTFYGIFVRYLAVDAFHFKIFTFLQNCLNDLNTCLRTAFTNILAEPFTQRVASLLLPSVMKQTFMVFS